MNDKTTLKVEPIEEGQHSREQLEKIADLDIEAFSSFFQEQLGNSSPTDFENYFLKTYLMWKLGAKMAE